MEIVKISLKKILIEIKTPSGENYVAAKETFLTILRISVAKKYCDIFDYLFEFLKLEEIRYDKKFLSDLFLFCCEFGDNYFLRLLMDMGISHKAELTRCVKGNNLEGCKLLIINGNLIGARGEGYWEYQYELPPLLLSIVLKNKEIFDFLLEYSDVNYVPLYEKNALILSIESEEDYFFQRLITVKNLDPNIRNGSNNNPLKCALNNKNQAAIEYLLNRPDIII